MKGKGGERGREIRRTKRRGEGRERGGGRVASWDGRPCFCVTSLGRFKWKSPESLVLPEHHHHQRKGDSCPQLHFAPLPHRSLSYSQSIIIISAKGTVVPAALRPSASMGNHWKAPYVRISRQISTVSIDRQSDRKLSEAYSGFWTKGEGVNRFNRVAERAWGGNPPSYWERSLGSGYSMPPDFLNFIIGNVASSGGKWGGERRGF